MNFKTAIILITLLVSLSQMSCSSRKEKEFSQISQSILNEILSSCPSLSNKDFIVYYFNPDCGLCLAQASELENKNINDEEMETLFIITSEIDDQVEFNIERFGLKSCILVDTNNTFEKDFLLNEKVIVDKGGKIMPYNGEQIN